MPEIQQMLLTAERTGHVSRAIIGLDFSMSRRVPVPPPPANPMYLLGPDGRPRLELIKGLVTFPMLRASVALLLEGIRHRRNYGVQGEALDSVYESSLAEHGGALGALEGRLRQFRESLRQPPNAFAADLRALRDTACQGGARLQVYIAPTHAAWMQAIRQGGLEPAWRQWKSDIVAASQERRDCSFEVWDFNTYNPITLEPIPAPGGSLRYSWDGVHFRTTTGDLILARMRDFGEAQTALEIQGFGVRLTPSNLEAELAQDRRDGSAYQRLHPDLLASLETRR
jgi:hypothetical protein